MAHNNQNHTKRASFILAVAVNLYAVIATYLYKNFQINLMDYATPIILWTVGIILTCAIVQRYFENFFAFIDIDFSFGKQIFNCICWLFQIILLISRYDNCVTMKV